MKSSLKQTIKLLSLFLAPTLYITYLMRNSFSYTVQKYLPKLTLPNTAITLFYICSLVSTVILFEIIKKHLSLNIPFSLNNKQKEWQRARKNPIFLDTQHNGKLKYTRYLNRRGDIIIKPSPAYTSDEIEADRVSFAEQFGLTLTATVKNTDKLTALLGYKYKYLYDRHSTKINKIDITKRYNKSLKSLKIQHPGVIPFGIFSDGQILTLDLFAGPLMLVAGKSNRGKSIIFLNMISVIPDYIPDAKMYLIDLTNQFDRLDERTYNTDAPTASFKYDTTDQLINVINELSPVAAHFAALRAEVLKRSLLLRQHKVQHFTHLPTEVRPVPLITIIDESHKLFMVSLTSAPKGSSPEIQGIASTHSQITDDVNTIIREARKFGIFIIMSLVDPLQSNYGVRFDNSHIRLAYTLGAINAGQPFINHPLLMDPQLQHGRFIIDTGKDIGIAQTWSDNAPVHRQNT